MVYTCIYIPDMYDVCMYVCRVCMYVYMLKYGTVNRCKCHVAGGVVGSRDESEI